jgi:hypothetical protein
MASYEVVIQVSGAPRYVAYVEAENVADAIEKTLAEVKVLSEPVEWTDTPDVGPAPVALPVTAADVHSVTLRRGVRT